MTLLLISDGATPPSFLMLVFVSLFTMPHLYFYFPSLPAAFIEPRRHAKMLPLDY